MDNKKIFRESSIERVTSPEQLNEYIRVAKPSVWIVLSAVVVLLAGAMVWAVFGTIETSFRAGAVCENGHTACYVTGENAKKLTEGLKVTVGEYSGVIVSISEIPVDMPEDKYLEYYSGIESGTLCYEVQADIPSLGDGIYEATIIVDTVKPITFIIQ